MENHGYDQIVGNPHAPYLNQRNSIIRRFWMCVRVRRSRMWRPGAVSRGWRCIALVIALLIAKPTKRCCLAATPA
jgi:hypothetical protein